MKTVLYFTQALENCIYCRQMEPVISKIIDDGFIVDKIQAFTPRGEHNKLNALWDIKATPTSIIIDENNEEIDRFVGPRPYSFMLDKLKD